MRVVGGKDGHQVAGRHRIEGRQVGRWIGGDIVPRKRVEVDIDVAVDIGDFTPKMVADSGEFGTIGADHGDAIDEPTATHIE